MLSNITKITNQRMKSNSDQRQLASKFPSKRNQAVVGHYLK